MTSTWARLRALTLQDQLALACAYAWLALFWLALRWVGFVRLDRLLEGREHGAACVPPSEVARLAHIIRMASNRSGRWATCLTRSMLLRWWLRRRGMVTQLCIGVRLAHGVLDAHAWVEHEGVPVNDSRAVVDQYERFAGSVSGADGMFTAGRLPSC
jgi:hypothetical protein